MDEIADTNLGPAPSGVQRGRRGRVISLLEGGYDTAPDTLGLARCVNAHVATLRRGRKKAAASTATAGAAHSGVNAGSDIGSSNWAL